MGELKTDSRTRPQTCTWATWSLVLGIVGLISCIFIIPVVFAILAIIFGIIALRKIKIGKGLLAGKSEAIAGIVLGGLWFVMIPLIASVAPGVIPVTMPFILSSRMYANESSAITSLKLMTNVEAVWWGQDPDFDGLKDYWTYDVSCIHRMYRRDGQTLVAFLTIDLARADTAPVPYTQNDFFGAESLRIGDFTIESPRIETWDIISPQAYSGYFFRAMLTDENGVVYNQKLVGSKQIPSCNINKFAFVAYPAIYGTTGMITYIVNQEGTIYYNDCGSDAKKIILQWPGNNPTGIVGPSGKPWRVYS